MGGQSSCVYRKYQLIVYILYIRIADMSNGKSMRAVLIEAAKEQLMENQPASPERIAVARIFSSYFAMRLTELCLPPPSFVPILRPATLGVS